METPSCEPETEEEALTKRERKGNDMRARAAAEREAANAAAIMVCADGTRRSLKRSPFSGAGGVAFGQAKGSGTSSNYPAALRELADAQKDALGRFDIVAVADARKGLGRLAKHEAMPEEEREALKMARAKRRQERGEA